MIRTVAETGSTNDDLVALAREGAPEGTWLRAERQTRGRGRQGRRWESPEGNLYASTLVRLRAADPPPASLALVAGVALHAVLEPHAGASLQLKWPNDLVAGGAKLAGILLERVENSVIVGFGVNLAAHPEGIDRAATDLRALTGRTVDAGSFLTVLAADFARWLERWRAEGLASICGHWLARAHPQGTSLSVSVAAGERVDGSFEGLDSEGALLLRLADGSLRAIQAGDVFLI